MRKKLSFVYGCSDDHRLFAAVLILAMNATEYYDSTKISCPHYSKMSDAEVTTTAIIGAMYFGGNFEKVRELLKAPNLTPQMLSHSRFNRRLHKLEGLLGMLLQSLGKQWTDLNTESVYSIDSFPIPVPDNIRISRSKISKREEYRGYQGSKRRYFYGVKIHLMVTQKDDQSSSHSIVKG